MQFPLEKTYFGNFLNFIFPAPFLLASLTTGTTGSTKMRSSWHHAIMIWNVYLSKKHTQKSLKFLHKWLLTSWKLFVSIIWQEEDWRTNQQYMDNIAQYPKDWYKEIVRKTRPRKKGNSADESRRKSDSRTNKEETSRKDSLPPILRRSSGKSSPPESETE